MGRRCPFSRQWSGRAFSRARLVSFLAAIFATSAATDAFAQRDFGVGRQDAAAKNLPPTAHAGGNDTGVAGEPMTFDGTQSYDPDGWIRVYEWDFGDGTAGRGRVTIHTYDSPGNYAAKLYVTDDDEELRDSTSLRTVREPEDQDTLSADFKVEKLVYVDPVTGEERWDPVGMSLDDPIEYGLQVRFDGTLSESAAHFRWFINGAGFGTLEPVQFETYTGPAEFDISLKVYDASTQNTDTITKTVYVGRGMESLSIMPWRESGSHPMSYTLAGTELWAVTLSGKLGVVDIWDPYDLPELTIVATENIDESDMLASSNGRVFVARQEAGVDVYLADRDNYALLGQLTPGDLNAYAAAFVGAVGDTLYVGTMSPYQIQVYDVSHLDDSRLPAVPTYKSAIDVNDGIVAGWQLGNDALVVRNTDLTLTIVDIRDPLNPREGVVLDPETTWISRAGTAGNLVYAVTPEGTKIWELVIPGDSADPIDAVPWAAFSETLVPLGVTAGRLYAQHNNALTKYNVVVRNETYLMDFMNPNGEGLFGGLLFTPADPALPQGPVVIVGTSTSTFESISP